MDNQLAAQESIRSLYELYSDDIYRYARLTLRDSNDACDVVQEVFLRAFRSWDSYRQTSNSKTWLMSIARNYMFDVFRKKRTEKSHIFLSEIIEVAIPESSEMSLEIEIALSRLKDTYRQVVILRHIENYSTQETAQILNWTEAKVRTTARRAIAKLREFLSPNSEEVDTKNAFRR
ncbi:RNA polymerase sigma factor [Alicyclobacillus fodiniaquatilis]|uniref:RNA polymerase sigma factor n=1 Tax=Alicyclobacillus fodiniaquatilis TaxID=1661150 RepID=A0ABW4JHN9_9BACL